MDSVERIADALQHTIPTAAATYARSSGFTKRASKLTARAFCEGLVFGVLAKPEASLAQLCQAVTARGVRISPQGLQQRFTPEAALFLHQVLDTVTDELLVAETPVDLPLLARFSEVTIRDSSTIDLPAELAPLWKGCGGTSGGEAALKLQVELDLLRGGLSGPFLQDGASADQTAPTQAADVPAETLRIGDRGYFNLDVFARQEATGSFYLTRWHPQVNLIDGAGRTWRPKEMPELLAAPGTDRVDLPLQLGSQARLPVRLIAVRVPAEVAALRRERLLAQARRKGQAVSPVSLATVGWTIILTNVPAHRLSIDEALALLRARWQAELLFKRWKSLGKVDTSRSAKPERLLCELYAKLIGVVIQHWLVLSTWWGRPDKSLWKGMETVQTHAMLLAHCLDSRDILLWAIQALHTCLDAGCRMNSRRTHPNTYQVLARAPTAA